MRHKLWLLSAPVALFLMLALGLYLDGDQLRRIPLPSFTGAGSIVTTNHAQEAGESTHNVSEDTQDSGNTAQDVGTTSQEAGNFIQHAGDITNSSKSSNEDVIKDGRIASTHFRDSV